YPNPAVQYIICEGKYNISRFEIYNISGMLVFQSGSIDRVRFQVEISHLSPGMYILRAYSKEWIPVQERFIKK
ncbi:MAG: T9SS type A sorting domain-containing protein, partial [Bacteroidota bacterium]